MELRTQRDLTRDEIAAAFQVNQFLLGMGELINRATAQTALFQFVSGVIDPLMYYIDDVLTKNLAHQDFGEHLFVKHDISSLRDVEKDLEYYRNGLELGWLTVNEVRKWEDLPIIDS
jgi:phage portal protein BeeE